MAGRRVVRRPQPEVPAAPARRVVRRPAQPLVRQPPFSGDDEMERRKKEHAEYAQKVRERDMHGEPEDNSRPYCTCRSVGGYGFDAHIGVYLHVACYKPSKAYYTAALQARVLVDPFNFKEQSSAG